MRTTEQWKYDDRGSIRKYVDPQSRTVNYWYDYQIPAKYTSKSDPSSARDARLAYDQDDYRGNVILTASLAGLTTFEYATDDEDQAALGQLIGIHQFHKIDATNSGAKGGPATQLDTFLQRSLDGRTWHKQLVRGQRDPKAVNGHEIPTPTEPPKKHDANELYEYNSDGMLARSQDPSGVVTVYTYTNRRIDSTTVTDPLTNQSTLSSFTYDTNGFPDIITTTSGNVTLSTSDYDYDAFGRLLHTEVKVALEGVSGLSLARVSSAKYDSLDRVIEETDGLGTTTKFEYDTAGNLTSTIAAQGVSYHNQFLSSSVSIAQTSAFTYYSDGSVKVETAPDGSHVNYYYDPLTSEPDVQGASRAWRVWDNVAGEQQNGKFTQDKTLALETIYDAYGRVARERDLLHGSSQKYTYANRRVDLATSVETNTKAITILPSGNLQIQESPRTDAYKFDAMGRIEWQKLGETAPQSYRYDELGNLTNENNLADFGQVNEMTYRADGAMLSQTEVRRIPGLSESFVNELESDGFGRMTRFKDPLAGIELNPTSGNANATTQAATVSRSVQSSGLTKETSTDRNGLMQYSWYDAIGQLRKTENAAGLVTKYDYDFAGNLIDVQQLAIGALPARHTSYQYDDLGRLRVTIEHGANPADDRKRYTDYFNPADGTEFDQAVTEPGGGVTAMAKDALGQLLFVQLPSVQVDGVGLANPVQVLSYSYSPENQTQVVVTINSIRSAPGTANMTYGQRQVTKSLLNDAGQVLERATELRSTTGSTVGYVDAVRFAYDNNGRTIYQSQGGRTTWYTYDDDKSGTGLVRKEALSDGSSVRDTFYSLDSAGQMYRKGSSLDVTTMDEHRLGYDALGRVIGESTPADNLSTTNTTDYVWLDRSTIYSGLVTKVIDQDGQAQVTTQGVDSSAHEFTSQVVATGLNKSITRAFRSNADGSLKQANSTQVVSSALSVTSSLAYLYNEFAQPIEQTSQASLYGDVAPVVKFNYAYAPSGNLDTVEERIGGTLLARRTYGWDALNRSTSITEDMASSAGSSWANNSIGTDKHITFRYDANSNLTGINRYKGTSATTDDRGATTISYFSTGKVHELTHSVATSSGPLTIGQFTQETFDNGKLKVLKKRLGANIREDVEFGFDARGNLKTITTTDLNSSNAPTVRNLTIDINENHSQASTAQFGFDGRIYEESTGVDKKNAYAYDKVGHVIQKLQKEYVQGETTGYYADISHTNYSRDLLGQLASVSDEHAHAVDYFYDALGREMARDERTLNASGATTSSKQLVILYDLTGRVMSIDLSSDQVVEHDLNGIAQTGVLAIDQTGAAGTTTTTVWQYANSGGDVTTLGVVESNGWLFRYRDFDEDGNVQRTAGDTHWALESVAVIWHGLRYDPFAELYRVGTSGMDPEYGRMISKVGGSYTFANNDPTQQYVHARTLGSDWYTDSFASMSDTTMVLGTVAASATLAIGIAAAFPISAPALGAGALALYAGGAAAGGAAGAASEYLRGGNAVSVLAAGVGSAGWSAINPLSGYGSLAGGLVGAGIAGLSGSDASQGFQWGELAGGFVSGGVQHYRQALKKFADGGWGARAAQKAAWHTGAAMGVEGAGIGIGAGIGWQNGGGSLALGSDPGFGIQFGRPGGGWRRGQTRDSGFTR